MKEINVPLGERSYSIVIGARLDDLGRRLKRDGARGRAHVITHPGLNRLFGARLFRGLRQCGFEVSFATFPEGERHKTLRTAQRLYRTCAQARLRRNSTIIALGGGVVGDVAGFVASTYLRGIRFVNVPTTLLGMVDAAIGGKTGLDLPQGKNLVGAFWQPALVWCDLGTLRTLPPREWKTGMAEVVKYGVIRDRRLFRFLEGLFAAGPPCPLPMKAVEWMVARSSAIKADIVSRDEHETKGLRQFLNFGHTVAHALEASTSYRKFTHGEAVSVGMSAAGQLAVQMSLFERTALVRLRRLLQTIGLPTQPPARVTKASFWKALGQDKKIEKDGLRFVLPTRIGRVVVRDVPRFAVSGALAQTREVRDTTRGFR